jgi:hypothetical protein
MDAGHHAELAKHLHDYPASFGTRFSLNSDVAATSKDRVVDPVGVGKGATADQEQGRENESEVFQWGVPRDG